MSELKLETPLLLRHFTGHRNTITQIRFSPTGEQVATSSYDGSVILWHLDQAMRCIRFSAHSGKVHCVAWSNKLNVVASGSSDRTVKMWQPRVKGISGRFIAHNKPVRFVDFNPMGNRLITASEDKSIKLWRVGSSRFLASFTGHTNWVRAAKFSADGKLVGSCGEDRTARVFDVSNGECLRTFSETEANCNAIAWHPHDILLAVGLSDGRVKIYDVANAEVIQVYKLSPATDPAVNDLDFHESGNFLTTASTDRTVKIIDLQEGRPIYTLTGHKAPVTAVNFSKDGQHLASGSETGEVLIWQTNLHTYTTESFYAGERKFKPGVLDDAVRRAVARKRELIAKLDSQEKQVEAACSKQQQQPKAPVPKVASANKNPVAKTPIGSTAPTGMAAFGSSRPTPRPKSPLEPLPAVAKRDALTICGQRAEESASFTDSVLDEDEDDDDMVGDSDGMTTYRRETAEARSLLDLILELLEGLEQRVERLEDCMGLGN